MLNTKLKVHELDEKIYKIQDLINTKLESLYI